jgi:hypothetical protein
LAKTQEIDLELIESFRGLAAKEAGAFFYHWPGANRRGDGRSGQVAGATGGLGLRRAVQGMEETEGDSRACSPWRGKDGKVVVGGTLGRRAWSHGGGDTPVLPRPREEAEEVWPVVAELPVASDCTGRWRPRRIDDGGGTPAGGSAGQGDRAK